MKFANGQRVTILDEELTILFHSIAMQKPRVYRANKDLVVHRGVTSPEEYAQVLTNWFKAEARAYITNAVNQLSEQHNIPYNRIAIKDTTSRWGSCSSKRNLNFSWRLILAPKVCMDYVIVHEFCHLQHLNHSADFWAMVERIMPDYRTARRWLRTHGKQLFET